MSHRVIAGSAKGRRLKLVPGDSTRPIMDRAKEALFSILGSKVVHARFLDLFGGTGAVGIEALSRGADEVVFIERNRRAIQTIKDNLEATHLTENARVIQTDAFEYLKQPPTKPFTFIYIAPPQYKQLWIQAIQRIDQSPEWVGDETEVIIQIDPKEEWDVELNLQSLTEFDRRKYGKTLLLFYAKMEKEA